MDAIDSGKDLLAIEHEGILRNSDANDRIMSALKSATSGWTPKDLTSSLIAARYLNSLGTGAKAAGKYTGGTRIAARENSYNQWT